MSKPGVAVAGNSEKARGRGAGGLDNCQKENSMYTGMKYVTTEERARIDARRGRRGRQSVWTWAGLVALRRARTSARSAGRAGRVERLRPRRHARRSEEGK